MKPQIKRMNTDKAELELKDNPLNLDPWISEVDKQAQLYSGGTQVIKTLSTMNLIEVPYCL